MGHAVQRKLSSRLRRTADVLDRLDVPEDVYIRPEGGLCFFPSSDETAATLERQLVEFGAELSRTHDAGWTSVVGEYRMWLLDGIEIVVWSSSDPDLDGMVCEACLTGPHEPGGPDCPLERI